MSVLIEERANIFTEKLVAIAMSSGKFEGKR